MTGNTVLLKFFSVPLAWGILKFKSWLDGKC